jgi:hypothetical protein
LAVLDPLALGSASILQETEDVFGLKKSSIVQQMEQQAGQADFWGTDAAKFWESSIAGINPQAETAKRMLLDNLKRDIKSGLASGSNIEGYTLEGRTTDEWRSAASGAGPGPLDARFGNLNRAISSNALSQITEQETAARVDAYLETLKTEGLDQETRKEFLDMYRTGARSVDIAARLQGFKEGTGVLGIRAQNTNQAKRLQANTTIRQGVL